MTAHEDLESGAWIKRADLEALEAELRSDQLQRLAAHWQLDCMALADIIASARNARMTLDDYLLTHTTLTETALYFGLAQTLALDFIADIFPVEKGFSLELTLSSGLVRLEQSKDPLPHYVATPTGRFFEDLILRIFDDNRNDLARYHLTTPTNFRRAVMSQFGDKRASDDSERLRFAAPDLSSSRLPVVWFSSLVALMPALAAFASLVESAIWTLSLSVFSGLIVIPNLLIKGMTLIASRRPMACRFLGDDQLPLYSVLVPLYRESKILQRLVAALSHLDYPKAKLQILLLIEEDDHETVHAIGRMKLNSPFEVVVCPGGTPRTKPRALAIGQTYARGDLLVVYDAEDLPESSQLRLAASYFAQLPDHIGCLQASLTIYNRHDSWLTRHFTFEYATLFDVLLPGMARLNMPIPLGGTSNHFRRKVLIESLGWDPWNVTEDADLGLRMKRFGFQTAWLPSSTFEEAPAQMAVWFNQRTRWFKGWMQTAIVHVGRAQTRSASLSVKDRILIALVATISVATALYHPLFLLLGTLLVDPSILRGEISLQAVANGFALGGVLVPSIILNFILLRRGARERSLKLTYRDIILQLPYSLLKFLAAWRALYELLVAPSHWRKTPHGLARSFSLHDP